MFHPAAALHLGTRMGDVREDFQSLKAFLASNPKAQPTLQQMELF
jgi:hypothetical protein